MVIQAPDEVKNGYHLPTEICLADSHKLTPALKVLPRIAPTLLIEGGRNLRD
jgi:hypothetical protein